MSQHRPAFDSGRLLCRSVFVLATLWVGLLPPGAAAQQFDVLIRGARVIDGSGNPWFRADGAILGEPDRHPAADDRSRAANSEETNAD